MSIDVYGVTISDERTGKIIVRRVSESIVEKAAIGAASNGTSIWATHGGSVPNSYRWKAVTEGLVAVGLEYLGTIYVCRFYTQLPANKVTLAGVAESACGGGARDIFDKRVSAKRRSAAKKSLLNWVRSQLSLISCDEMEKLGVCVRSPNGEWFFRKEVKDEVQVSC